LKASLYDRLGGREGIFALIRPFYTDVQQHAVLGPIFNQHIQDWPAHLEKIAEFWARQTGGPSNYGGGFGAAHLRVGVEPGHFQHWLGLWEFNCRRQLKQPESDEMIAIAYRIATQLQRIVAGRPGIRIGE
jgi:hemoglobin